MQFLGRSGQNHKKISVVFTLAAASYLLVLPEVFAESVTEILKKADDIRNPPMSNKLSISVETEGEETVELEVSMQGKDKTLVRTVKPARDRGKNMLMIGEDMWVFVPNLKRTVRVSLNQKLTGQAANGDICRQRWSGDYNPSLERETANVWILLLDAEKSGLTYDKIRLWVNKSDYRPVKAEYLTKTAKVLKKATFKNYKKMAGAMRPSVTVIANANKKDDKSVVTTLEITPMNFPDSLFNQNNLN